MNKENKNCAYRIGDEVKLASDADTVYKIEKIYPSKLKLTTECKYDLLSTIDKIILPNVLESQIRNGAKPFPKNSLKLIVIFQLVFLLLVTPPPISAQTNLEKTRIDFLVNLAALKKYEDFSAGCLELLKNPNHQYTLTDNGFDYFGSFDPATGKVTFASKLTDNEIEINENVGKVKYIKSTSFRSIYRPNQYTEISTLKSKFDGSTKILFQVFRIENRNILKSSSDNTYELKGFEPMPNSIEREMSMFQLSDGQILLILKYGYEALTSKLYRDIGSTGVGSISRSTETRYLTQLVSFSEDGRLVNTKMTYLFPEKYEVRPGPNGSFAIVASQTFKPVLLQKLSVDVLNEFSSRKDGIGLTFFDSNLSIRKHEQVDKKKDERIKDSRLISATSDTNQLMILFASNQTGSINEEALTANIYDFNNFSFVKQLVNEQSLKIDPYFHVTSSFFDSSIAYFVFAAFQRDTKVYKINLSESYFGLKEIPFTYFKVEP
jgi:hypothetical protein